ncbi:hypothetical protein P154DRAFT_328634 [Amniculicola lignicola CBS 123094]|uniref:Uncharacterized protein n=1 Tax=Amniculicola lignicola CBS 123094 TaxID=1392246 RepID=A0A6A5W4U2_9PLEO|nr:hypothetical protein P154DRAFT_328634 [Amniculicola lignicola CBS 123094]
MSSYGSQSGTYFPQYGPGPHQPQQQQQQQAVSPPYHNPSTPNIGVMIPHPQNAAYQQQPPYSQDPYSTQQRQLSHSQLHPQIQQRPSQGRLHPQQPPYVRQTSQQSHRSRHSHHSHHDDDESDTDRYEADREMEKRPSLGDTLYLMWGTVVGAISGRRR